MVISRPGDRCQRACRSPRRRSEGPPRPCRPRRGRPDRLADVLLDPGELLGVLLDEGREPPEEPAVGRGNRPPRREGLLRPRHRRVGLLDPGLFELRDRLLAAVTTTVSSISGGFNTIPMRPAPPGRVRCQVHQQQPSGRAGALAALEQPLALPAGDYLATELLLGPAVVEVVVDDLVADAVNAIHTVFESAIASQGRREAGGVALVGVPLRAAAAVEGVLIPSPAAISAAKARWTTSPPGIRVSIRRE